MWKTQVFNGSELVLEHAQNDYGKVMRFTVQSLAELMNANVQDFRITMVNKQGVVFFHAIGPATQTTETKTKRP